VKDFGKCTFLLCRVAFFQLSSCIFRSELYLMPRSAPGRIVCLSNVFDEHYQAVREEAIPIPLSSSKRRALFRCLEDAAERELIVFSSPPKALQRRAARWLPRVSTTFSTHRQLVCANLDARKIRIPLGWLSYAAHVARHTRSGDIVIIDNFEFIYVVAACAARLRRRLRFVLDYEDGKHAIDRGWQRWLSGAAELLGRPLLRGAIVAHPSLARRLPKNLPTELVPGFFDPPKPRLSERHAPVPVKFLYSGSLDGTRGVDLLLESLPLLPPTGWELDFTGSGPLESQVVQAARDPRWQGRVRFHGVLPNADYENLMVACNVALNCQRHSDPISDVTYPSKTFTYLSAGLRLISSTASGAREVLGDACWYYSEETPAALAALMSNFITDGLPPQPEAALREVQSRYSTEGTTSRLRTLLTQIESS
jgi:glycosyltransferase involved in cell wall biosynthesis